MYKITVYSLLWDQNLLWTSEENDLGITMDRSVKTSAQIQHVAAVKIVN